MERLKIKNFGPITDLDIDLKKINVFIGEQGVGKGTIAKLISCLRDIFLCTIILEDGNTEKALTTFKTFGIHEYLRPDSYIEYHSLENYAIRYSDSEFSIAHSSLSSSEFKDVVINACALTIQKALKVLGHTEEQPLEDENVLDKYFDLFISPKLRTSLYCPAERGIVSALSPALVNIMRWPIHMPGYLLEYMGIFEKARNHYGNYCIPFLNLEYSYSDGEDKVIMQGQEKPLALKYCSSGIQAVLPMLMSIDYCLTQRFFSSYTIEELELNLFPTNQRELLNYLISKTNIKDDDGINNLVLTTHSPYLLAIMNVAILAGKIIDKFPEAKSAVNNIIPESAYIKPEDIAVFSLQRPKDNSTPYCSSVIDNETGMIQGNFLDSVSNFISSDFSRLHQLYLSELRKNK